MPTAKRSTRTLLFVAAWVVALAYAWTYLDRGWVPHDEGTLAFSAERVMDGMVPHLDYDEVYTGGLAFAGAAAFKVFGVDLFTLRLLLFALFALWIPVVYWSARRFATPSLSVVVTLLAGAWSIPAYSAAIPSWFNLFFAGFAVACLLRHLETSGRRWLVAAGIAAGVSILVKVVGLYLVAGCLLALAFFEQAAPRRDLEPRESSGRLYSGLVTAAGIALSLLVWSVVRQVAEPVVFLHFVLPAALLSGWLAVTEWRRPPSIARVRVGALAETGPSLPGRCGDPVGGVRDPVRSEGGARRPLPGRLRRAPAKTRLCTPAASAADAEHRAGARRPRDVVAPPRESPLVSRDSSRCCVGCCSSLGAWQVYPRVWFSMRSLIPVVTRCPVGAARSKGARGAVALRPRPGTPRASALQLPDGHRCFEGHRSVPVHGPYLLLVRRTLVALTALADGVDGTALRGAADPPGRLVRSRPVFGVVLILPGVRGTHLQRGYGFLRDDQTARSRARSLRVSSQGGLRGTRWETRPTSTNRLLPGYSRAPEVYFLTGLSTSSSSTKKISAYPLGARLNGGVHRFERGAGVR